MFRFKITTYSLFLLGKNMLLVHDLGQNVYLVQNTREYKNFRNKDTLVHVMPEFVVTFLQDWEQGSERVRNSPFLIYEHDSQHMMLGLHLSSYSWKCRISHTFVHPSSHSQVNVSSLVYFEVSRIEEFRGVCAVFVSFKYFLSTLYRVFNLEENML